MLSHKLTVLNNNCAIVKQQSYAHVGCYSVYDSTYVMLSLSLSLSLPLPLPPSLHTHIHTQVVEVYRENTVLGLRVMGGADRPKHIFRQGDRPGIFILEVLSDGAAALCGKLKSGDRILKVLQYQYFLTVTGAICFKIEVKQYM